MMINDFHIIYLMKIRLSCTKIIMFNIFRQFMLTYKKLLYRLPTWYLKPQNVISTMDVFL